MPDQSEIGAHLWAIVSFFQINNHALLNFKNILKIINTITNPHQNKDDTIIQ